jgi:TPR repeat protein
LANNNANGEGGLGGLPKDEAQAVEWFRKAADAGSEPAMNSLGEMYENGRGGLPKDEVQAVSWYRKAADAGIEDAKAALKRLGY